MTRCQFILASAVQSARSGRCQLAPVGPTAVVENARLRQTEPASTEIAGRSARKRSLARARWRAYRLSQERPMFASALA